jgi:hypothetical protein
MAMTGMRRMTTGLGLLRQPPPEMIATEGVPGLLARVPPRYRDEAIELAHWTYGAAGGAAFGLLPAIARRAAWSGPLYGMLAWLAFEAVLAPVLGLPTKERWHVSDRVAVASDHVLYGLVVSGRPSRN